MNCVFLFFTVQYRVSTVFYRLYEVLVFWLLACVTLVTVGVTLVTNSSFIHCTCPRNEDTVNVPAFRRITPPCLDIPPLQSRVLHTHIPLSISPSPLPSTPHAVPVSGSKPLHILKETQWSSFLFPSISIFVVWAAQSYIPCHRT